jgi:signal peptidase I
MTPTEVSLDTPTSTEAITDAPGGTDSASNTPGSSDKKRRSTIKWLIEWGVIVVIALVIAGTLRLFVFQTFFIPSPSMYPTLQVGDRIIVNKLAFDFHPVDRGDIVVFSRPPLEHEKCGGPLDPDLVKRVIGLPTETISFSNNTLFVDGKATPQPWFQKDATTYTTSFGPVHIPKNDYFVMGDNRIDSCDSRRWGFVPRTTIVGGVIMRVWPLHRLHFF